jgi:hypothetical protein
MTLAKKVGSVVGKAGGAAVALKSAITAEWDPETGRLAKVVLFGFIPVFDRRRMEARRAARKEGRRKRDEDL